MSKKILTPKTFIILGIIVLISLLCFIFRYQIKNGIFYLKTMGITKDIIIVKETGSNVTSATGYASTSEKYYVDLNKKTIYYIEDYNVYQPNAKDYGHHYTLMNSKKLNDGEINELINLASIDSNYVPAPDALLYYNITYKDKIMYLDSSNAQALSNIINSLSK